MEKYTGLKRIGVSVTNDLAGDNRVHKVCLTLSDMGFEVLLIGRRLTSSQPLAPRSYPTRRMRLLFNKGPLFYAEFNLRLFLFLLFNRFGLFLSNDLDTLPANFLASRFKRKPLVYDSHEFFTEAPELMGRPLIRKIWKWMESKMVPRVDAAYTVCQSISEAYTKLYNIPFDIVRNLPLPAFPGSLEWGKAERNRKTILYQGALNIRRGLESAIMAMHHVDEADLVIAGSGDLEAYLKKLVIRQKLKNVRFTGKLPQEELIKLTCKADAGISLEEDFGLNYRYALPNKLFDYIQARIPVIISDLPEMRKVVTEYDIGLVAPDHEPESLAALFRKVLWDHALRQKWAVNLEKAARELTWESEDQKIRHIFGRFLDQVSLN